MQHIPWFSTFTVFTETIVTVGILYVFYQAYKYNRFRYALVATVLGYELLFNISYMAYRATVRTQETVEANVGLAIFHGTFSLLMFILLVVFMSVAWQKYKQGVNFFAVHKILTTIFLISWLVAIFSGYAFYYQDYLRPAPNVQVTIQK